MASDDAFRARSRAPPGRRLCSSRMAEKDRDLHRRHHQHDVYALDETTGASSGGATWGCFDGRAGHHQPLGILGTPVIDAATRTIYLTPRSAPAPAFRGARSFDRRRHRASGRMRGHRWSVKSGATSSSRRRNTRAGAIVICERDPYVPFGGRNGDQGPSRMGDGDRISAAMGPSGLGDARTAVRSGRREAWRLTAMACSPPREWFGAGAENLDSEAVVRVTVWGRSTAVPQRASFTRRTGERSTAPTTIWRDQPV